jgi:NAD(P)-dependent dehydrogenase (short-subunit alcohol dehydrogenase family)
MTGAPRLAGKVALVTGAASGIGLAAAERFGAEGALVACVDLDEERAARARERVAATGAEAHPFAADVSDEAAIEAAVHRTIERFGRLDVVMANAGIQGTGMAHSTPIELWDRVLQVNLTGVFLTIRAALPHMMERRSGAIVATASIAALTGVSTQAAYSAAKGGVAALVRQLAVDYAGYGIRVNALCPATVVTPLVRRAYEERGGDVEELLRERGRDVPLGRLGEPPDVANLALFLASDEAAWMTGAVLPVDGGLSAAMVPGYTPPAG